MNEKGKGVVRVGVDETSRVIRETRERTDDPEVHELLDRAENAVKRSRLLQGVVYEEPTS